MSAVVGKSADKSQDEITVVDEPASRPRFYRSGTFGPASELPLRRRTSDWIRLVVAFAAVMFFASRINDINATEQSVFEFVNSLPSSWKSFFHGLYAIAALWAVGLVATAAIVAGRWRLARDLALAGATAWIIARGLGAYFAHDVAFTSSFGAVFRLGEDAVFPVPRLALVVAIVSVASPYLIRPTRRIGQLLVFALAIATMYLGAGYPNDVLAAIVLGWGVAAAIHLIFKSPGGRPTQAQVHASLMELGVDARNVRLVPVQPDEYTLMSADTNNGTLLVKVFGRDEASAQLLGKIWRFIAYKDSGPSIFVNRRQQVEHEAYVLLLASTAGVQVPRVEAAGTAGPGAALLVLDDPPGPSAAEAGSSALTDDVLGAIWQQVSTLQTRGITHGSLNLSAVKLTLNGAVLVDFNASSTSATPLLLGADVAEMLTSMANVVGEDRAVNSAVQYLSREQLVNSISMLQSQALSRATRHELKRKDLSARLSKLRELVAAATGIEEPTVTELHRVAPANLGMAIGTLLAVSVLLSQVGDPQEVWNTIKNASWGWVVVSFALALASTIGWAIALLGSVPIRLSLMSAIEVQLAMNFAQLAVPGVGAPAMQIRYLQKQGMDISAAVATGGILAQIGMVVTQVVLFIIALAVSPATLSAESIPTSSIVEGVLIIIAVCFIGVGLLVGVPKLRRNVLPKITEAALVMWQVVRSPSRVALLVIGNVIASLFYASCYQACLIAYGGHLDFSTILAANIFIGTIASLIPVPGGAAAVGAVGMSGVLTAAGVPAEIAIAAVLTYQIVAGYLPALPGWFATNDLVKRNYL